MSRKALIITYTYYQLIAAIQLKRTILSNDFVDIIITNHSDGSDKTAERLKAENLFQHVYYIEDDDGAGKKKLSEKVMRYLKARVSPKRAIRNHIELKEKYDVFFFSTPSLLAHLIALYSGNKMECYRFEDGYSTYTRPFLERTPLRRFLINTVFGNMERCVKGIYLYHPELFLQSISYPIHKIKILSRADTEFKEILNRVFDYENNREKYETDFIFLEESFRASGIEMDDDELIDSIAETVGAENIVIKSHPRNKGIFRKGKIKNSEATGQPWELILMNEKFDGKTLLTITSGASFASVLFDFEPVTTYLLFKCLKNKSPMLDDEFLEYVSKVNENGGDIKIPESKDDLLEELKYKNNIKSQLHRR